MTDIRSPAVDSALDRLARRRASAKMGWFIHAAVYAIVNLGLAALSLSAGRDWHAYPLLGWGLGLGHPRRGGVADRARCRAARAPGRTRARRAGPPRPLMGHHRPRS